jgi:hypothetical protein
MLFLLVLLLIGGKIVGICQSCIDESRENILFQNVKQFSSAKNDYEYNCLFDMMKLDS